MTKSCLILFSVSLLLFSCSKEEEPTVPDTTSEYAGLAVGKYVVYDVDSIGFDDFDGSIDTSIYQIKETVDSEFTDLEGDQAFKIIRYRRDADTLAWTIIDVWSSKITGTNFQKTEENLKYIKLIFPARENKTWNGNVANNLLSQDYQYTAFDQPETIGGQSLEKVLTVLQYDSPDKLIRPEFFEEKYAKGIGMVYKRSMSLVRANTIKPWLGYDVTMTLSSYGG